MSDKPWDGVERRKVDKDWIERDRLLSEVHSDIKHMVVWAKEHTEEDNKRFGMVDKRVNWLEKTMWLGIGGLSLLIIIVKLIPVWYQIK